LSYAVNPDGNPNTADGADVINLSISTHQRTRLLRELIESAGPVIVAAAGNAASSEPEYPAAENVDGLIAVGASTQADALASFSNRGSWVHVAAPGVGVFSSAPGGGYATWSGTSMATALVAGEAALLAAANPRWGAREIAERIENTAVRIRGDVEGRIDAGAAITGTRTR
jgi:subtilisin family serine protease